ncbi:MULTISPECIES: hypothetical protein [Halobacterium]|uniref:DUF7112 family protein n=1 Tax=Halobacterium TaxID=2239 RepID=UPI001965ADBB|nr:MULTISPECIES: hypothetical protein [Halobacterium]MDL0121401.1 hypothetical protein [Halobacterium salinarum]MDL0127324.1 hypothetical protein [Halobacterium salinarum]QRY25356.1 hypothetical protein JRZ79_02825 [Halobacterium sp. BOL4-2]
MTERVTHETVQSGRGSVVRAGGTRRLAVQVPADSAASLPVGDVVRVVLDGSEHHASVAATADDTPVVRGAYATPRLARQPNGADNELAAWLADAGLEAGRSVHVDVVAAGFKYGLRAPGETATYESTGTPDEGLADIAASLGDGDGK